MLKPIPPKPKSMRPQVAGSGTAELITVRVPAIAPAPAVWDPVDVNEKAPVGRKVSARLYCLFGRVPVGPVRLNVVPPGPISIAVRMSTEGELVPKLME